jgi:glycosyltransferase involved in cell wall biosynthesis
VKIAFIFPPIWPVHLDGSLQIWNREVTARLSKRCDVRVYSGIFGSKDPDLVDGVRYRRISTRPDNRLLKRFQYVHDALGIKRPLFSMDIWYTAYAFKIALDLRKHRCDLVHIYNYPQFARIIKWFNPEIRVVLNMHGEWLTQVPFSDLHARLRNVDLIISCSDLITKSTAAKFPDIASRCRTVPMGVSTDAFSHANYEVSPNTLTPRKLLYVGRISPEKGVHDLLDAFELICQRYPDASLTIVGSEGVAPREYIVDLCLDQSLISRLAPFYENGYLAQMKQRLGSGAGKRVTFAGSVAHSEISKHYAAADVYISPSFYESFGMSIIEAMAAGLPVVATRGGAVPDLISDGCNGLLVDVNNPSAIADAVGHLFESAKLRKSLSSAAHEMVCEQFSWEMICSELMQMYQDVLDPARVGARGTSFEGASV